MNVNINDIAALASLDLTPEESQAMQRDLTSILDYVAQLSRIPTEGVEAMDHLGAHLAARVQAPAAQNPESTLRADCVRKSFPQPEALANAPAQAGEMFEVPKIVDRG